MIRSVAFLPEAGGELKAAAEWYDDRAALGDDLVAEVQATVARIAEAPESFTLAAGGPRGRWSQTGVREAVSLPCHLPRVER